VDVYTVLGRCVGHEEEGFKSIEEATESVQFAILLEGGLYLVEIIS
jgi:hypothetical protein